MNAQQQELLNEGFTMLLELTKTAVKTTQIELPLLAQEVIYWGTISYTLKGVLFLIPVIVFGCSIKHTLMELNETYKQWPVIWLPFGSVICFVSLGASLACWYKLVYIIVSPKLYLIDYIKNLM